MSRTPSPRRHARNAAIAWISCAGLLGSGCALLIPSSWRGSAPIPLAGPIDPAELDGPAAEDLARLSDEELRARVAADRERLSEIASTAETAPFETPEAEAELREIANRLPRMQRELESRGGGGAGSRIRHPVIQ